jgi:benzaldehyde dehydrogenase (NAD)
MQFEKINPVSNEVASVSEAMQVGDVLGIVAQAHQAFPVWSGTLPNERRRILMQAAASLQGKKEQIIDVMLAETGCTKNWAVFNVVRAVSIIQEAAAMTTQISGELIPSDVPGCLAMSQRVPMGVILGIAPWNAPLILGVRAIAVPLACANTVIFKASEKCPQTHALMIEALKQADFPEGAVNIVTNAPQDAAEVVNALIDNRMIRHINFTGSTAVGRLIAKRAAEHLKPCLLELGGKAPLIVLEDADLDEAVAASAFGAFMNQGQICMSTERLVLIEEVADVFIEKFVAKVASLKVGDPCSENAPLGAVIDSETISRVNALVEDALEKGATLITGGIAETVLMSPTVLDGVIPQMKIYYEETFGPVISIIRAANELEAIRIANDTDYGLSASVFTRDSARGLRVANQINSGICHINAATVHDEAQMPFGGMGASGYGRFGGKAGIDSFTHLRWITLDTEPRQYPI